MLVCDRAHQTLLNAAFMARLGHVLMEEKACGDFLCGPWGEFGSLFLYLEML